MRGRTEPEDEGRADDDALPLLVEDEAEVLPEGLAVVVGLLPEEGLAAVDGLPPEEGLAAVEGLPLEAGLAPDEGFAVMEGELADGVAGLSDAGGTFACANGAPPPLERL